VRGKTGIQLYACHYLVDAYQFPKLVRAIHDGDARLFIEPMPVRVIRTGSPTFIWHTLYEDVIRLQGHPMRVISAEFHKFSMYE